MAKVGLFFYVNRNILFDFVDVSQAEVYGDFRIGNSSHYDIWDEKYDKIHSKPYDYFPRGRVVYQYKENKYILYADKCIDEKAIKDIVKIFGIENESININRTDAHYVCKGCNKDYLE